MAEFVKLASDIIKKRSKEISADGKGFLIHKAQCIHLLQNLEKVLKALAPSFKLSLSVQETCLPLFKRFYMLVLQADSIMTMCSCEQRWLEAAIFYGDNPLTFKQLVAEFQSCIDLFHCIPESHSSTEIEGLPSLVKKAIHDIADEDFHQDVANLRSKLERIVLQADSGEREKHLARYVIDREKSRLSPNWEDPDLACPRVERFHEVLREDPVPVRYLGHGGYGTVSLVNWLGLDCAKKDFGKLEDARGFVKEVETLVKLNHPHIVRLLGSKSVESEHSFMMELMPMSLYDFINAQKGTKAVPGCMPFAIVAAIEMMLQTALGMKYLHEQGVVHRDLKSMNILVAPSPHDGLPNEGYSDVKLTDFGLAKVKVYDLVEPTGKMLGTLSWIAPEAMDILPSQRIDWRKADVYSFGITCSEILAGEVPYSESVPRMLRPQIKGGLRPTLPPTCPCYLTELLQRCWAENPEERPSFEEITRILTRFRACLFIGIEPDISKSAPFLEKLWNIFPFNYDVQNAKFNRHPVLCPDPSEEVKVPFKTAVKKHIYSKLDMVEVLCCKMKEHLTKVQVCHTQCNHLVERYLEGVHIVRSTYKQVSLGLTLWKLYRSKELEQCSRCLDSLICSMMAVEDLLRRCGGSEWTRTALAISMPLPEPRTLSIFGIYLRELSWHLFVINHVMLGTTTSRFNSWSIHWCTERCSLVLRRITNNEDADDEFLEADAFRQNEDRKNVLVWHLEKSSIVCSADSVFSCFRPSEVPLNDQIVARLKKNLENPSATIKWELYEDCYDIDHVEFEYQGATRYKCPWMMYESKWFGEVVVVIQTSGSKKWCRKATQMLARVQHPNVVQFIGYRLDASYDFGDRSVIYFVMELMQENLWSLIERNTQLYSGAPFSLLVSIDILLQIVKALLHVHKCGVMQRHLDPSNILVSPKYALNSKTSETNIYYIVKLTGLPLPNITQMRAQWLEKMAVYMAPEMWSRRKEYTWSVDVWSFGFTGMEGRFRPSFEQIQKKLWTLKYNEEVGYS